MAPIRTFVTALAALLVLQAGTFVAGVRLGERSGAAARFAGVLEKAEEISRKAATPVSDDALARAAIRGMLEVLEDPYAALLTPEQRRQVDDLLGGSIVGIGVWLERAEDGLLVESVVPGTPAEEAGVRSGDLILRIAGTRVGGASVADAAKLIRGREGTTVRLAILRGSERLLLDVRRGEIDSDVRSRMLDDRVGYAHLLRFGRGAGDELRASVRGLLEDGAEALVLDLRGNTGGLAEEAIRVASLFLDGGVVAIYRERGEPERQLRAREDPLPDIPLAVLVDGGTASASELVAGALQDRGRATLVGLRTFGKGSVLTLSGLGEEDEIQYTTAFFFTPSGARIEGVGVTPDREVLPGGPEDAQLDVARAVAADALEG